MSATRQVHSTPQAGQLPTNLQLNFSRLNTSSRHLFQRGHTSWLELMTLSQASSFLRLWTRTSVVHRHAIAPISAAPAYRPLQLSRPYGKYTRKKTPPIQHYQRPPTGPKFYLAIVNWAQQTWREKLRLAQMKLLTILKVTLHVNISSLNLHG